MKLFRNLTLSAMALLLIPSLSFSEEPSLDTPMEITCYIQDIEGKFYPEWDWARENLLVEGVYEATRRNKSVNLTELLYNQTLTETPSQILEVHIQQWRRSHSGFYEFRATASYYDASGEKHALGVISGTESSITTFTRFDHRDAFVDVVKRAIEQGLRKIEKIDSQPES